MCCLLFSYLNVDKVPLLAVVESKLILLWSESLVVVDESLNLSLGQLGMAVVDLRKNRGDVRRRHFFLCCVLQNLTEDSCTTFLYC